MKIYHDQYRDNLPVEFDDTLIVGPVRAMADYWCKARYPHQRCTALYPFGTPTLKMLIDLAKLLDCEVGAFLNTKKQRVCIGVGEERSTPRPGTTAERRKKFKFIAHSHPTTSTIKGQLSQDLQISGDQVEVAVNANGFIMYYSEGHCYNRPVGHLNRLTDQVEARVQGPYSFTPNTIDVNTPLTSATLAHLGVWSPPAMQIQVQPHVGGDDDDDFLPSLL